MIIGLLTASLVIIHAKIALALLLKAVKPVINRRGESLS